MYKTCHSERGNCKWQLRWSLLSSHQITVAQDNIHKTAVITPFGLYKFLRTPFGLWSDTQAFQQLMDSVCKGLDFVYLDNFLVASQDTKEHKVHLATLFDWLQEFGLVLNVDK